MILSHRENPTTCWLCKKEIPAGEQFIPTRAQPPDNKEWDFHVECYWKLQEILNG